MNDNQSASNMVHTQLFFCPKCGKKNKTTAKFCAFCGNKIPAHRLNTNQTRSVNHQPDGVDEDDSEVTQILRPAKQQTPPESNPTKRAPSQKNTIKEQPVFETAKQTATKKVMSPQMPKEPQKNVAQQMPQSPQKSRQQMPQTKGKNSQAFNQPVKTKREESPVHQKAVFSDVKPAVSSDVKVRDKAAFSPVNQKNADVSQTTGRRPENQRAVSLQKGSSRTQSSVFETETLPDQSMFETETIKEPVSIFAQGLPDWTITPPEVPVRRKRRK